MKNNSIKPALFLTFLTTVGQAPIFGQACCPDGNSIISNYAGTGGYGHTGDGGPATLATFADVQGLALDAAGDLYVVDSTTDYVRMISPLGIVTTVAGNGSSSTSGDGGPATLAGMNNPTYIAVDSAGNLYISEFGANRIRKVDTSGTITTFAGSGSSSYSGDGGPATLASLKNPWGVAVDPVGDVYISDNNCAIRKVDTSGIITTVAGNGSCGFSGDGGPATLAKISRPDGPRLDGAGNIYFWDNDNNRIRRIDAVTGIITTVAGNGSSGFSGIGGPATLASLTDTDGAIAFCGGNMYIGDYADSYLMMVNSCGIIQTIAGNGSSADTGDGGPASLSTMSPENIIIDPSGTMYVAVRGQNKIRKIVPDCSPTPTFNCTLVPTSTPTPTNSWTPTWTATSTASPTPTTSSIVTPTSCALTSATLSWASDDAGEIFINGYLANLCGNGCWTGFNSISIPITWINLSGDNVLAAYGYATDTVFSASTWQLKLNYSNCSSTYIQSGDSCVLSQYLFNPNAASASLPTSFPAGWNNVGFNDSSWAAPATVGASPGICSCDAIPAPGGGTVSWTWGNANWMSVSVGDGYMFREHFQSGAPACTFFTPTLTTTSTVTLTFTPTPSATLTYSVTPSFTPTVTSTPSASFTPTLSPTNTWTPTETDTPTPTSSATNSSTPTDSFTPTMTFTPSASFTPTPSPTNTWTPTQTDSPTPTSTATNSFTPTSSPTSTNSFTPTDTDTPCGYPRPTCTFTPTFPVGCGSFYLSKNLFLPGQGPVSIDVAYCDGIAGTYLLRIYNSAGEHIRTLDEKKIGGLFDGSYLWDGTNKYGDPCASGVYILYLVEPDSTRMKRILLVR